MSAVMVKTQLTPLEQTEELLYEWSDECRSLADELGLPTTSGIARMIQQQRVFEGKLRGVRRKRRRLHVVKREQGKTFRLCDTEGCGNIFNEAECPKCKRDPKQVALELGHATPDLSARGTHTQSFKPLSITQLSANTALIEQIVRTAPNDFQKVIFRKFLFRQRDSKAAQDFRVRKATYDEWVAAAVEYVAEQIKTRSGGAMLS